MNSNLSEEISRDREGILSTFEALFKARGMGDVHGRVFGALILFPRALTQDEISSYTGYSVPAISAALDDLDRMGFIQKSKKQNSRKNFYSSKLDLDAAFRGFIQAIHDQYIIPAFEKLNQSEILKKNDLEVQEHLEVIKRYRKELEDLKKYIEKLLSVPLEV
ncbi:MAG: transcriptional regulator, TrmB [Methanocellales archaeon]